jgi:hypothetical protein
LSVVVIGDIKGWIFKLPHDFLNGIELLVVPEENVDPCLLSDALESERQVHVFGD